MQHVKPRFTFQTLVYILLVGAFAYWSYTYRDQLADILDVLQQGIWYIIVGTVFVLAAAMYNQAALYASIYRVLELPAHRHEMLPLYLVRRFVMVAAPSGGFSGWVPFLQFARRREIGVGTVFVANLIYTILWYSTFLLFLLFGLIYLFIAHDLQWFEISAALVMLVGDLVMVAGLVLAWVAPRTLDKVLHAIATASEWLFRHLKRQPPLTRAQLTTFFNDLEDGVASMKRAGFRRLMEPVGHALLNEALHTLMFFLVALAFGEVLHFGVLVTAYSISILFWVVSPTPGGLGFVEGTLILVLTSLQVPAHSAMVITLAYRGITFWLPFVLGFASLRWFNKLPQTSST